MEVKVSKAKYIKMYKKEEMVVNNDNRNNKQGVGNVKRNY